MIDPSIPLMAKGIDGLQMLDDGNKLAQLWQGQKVNAEMGRLYKQAGGDQAKMMELGQNSPLMHLVMPKLQEQQAAQQNALIARQKTLSEIGKTNSEAFKNNQQGSGFGLDNSGKLLAAANQALYVGTQSGDPNAVKLALNNAKKAGYFDSNPEAYNQYFATVEELSAKPEELKSFALNLQKAYAQNPEKYNFTTAGEDLASKTAIQTTGMNNKTSEYVANSAAATAAAKLKQEGEQFKKNYEYTVQQDEIKNKQGEIKEFGGNAYIVYKNGDYRPLVDESGQPVKSQAQKPMSATTQKELFEVGDSIAAGSNAITNLRDALKYSANAYDGVGAIQRAKAMGHVSNDESARNTVLLDNIVSGNALEMLKATFGGAPTEGERKILLDLQGSANLPSDQREAIYTRAIAAAERRLAANEKKAEGLRDGSYFKPSQLQQSQVPSSGAGQKKPTSVVDAAASKYGF